MNYFLIILSFFWLICETKAILFWLYLWQLKEYHLGRFIDHFRTKRGQNIFLNWLFFLKIILAGLVYFFNSSSVLLFVILVFYFFESLRTIYDFIRKKIKKPIFTKKIIFLFFFSLGFILLYFYPIFIYLETDFAFLLLIFDIFSWAIISAIVLTFQPISVFEKCRLINKAKKKRNQFKNLLVIGITGSYGKTSTKEFLYTILAEKFGKNKVLKTKEHQNSEVGISRCILNDLKKEHEIFIVEMGAYNKGGIKLLCDITKPKIGILTGINEQHMATYGSFDNIINTKLELIQSLPEDGLAIINLSNSKIKNLKLKVQNSNLKLKNIKFFSISEKLDIWAENIKVEKDKIFLKVNSKDGDFAEFQVNLFGIHNIENILAAACCAKELKMDLKEISKACQKIEPWQSGIQIKSGINGLNIIDSTYSANLNGVLSHLEYLKILPGKKVIVMPCLIELGSASKEAHKKIGQKIGEVCDLAIITSKDRYKEIKEAASVKTKGSKNTEILFIENPKEIFEKIKNFCVAGDNILLESRVPVKLIDYLTNK